MKRNKLIASLAALVSIIACLAVLSACGDKFIPEEVTFEKPVISFRTNTANGEISWDCANSNGNIEKVTLKATANGNTQEIAVPFTGQSTVALTDLAELQTEESYEISLKINGFNFIHTQNDRSQGRIDRIFHDSSYSNTLTYYRVLRPSTSTNFRLGHSADGHTAFLFDMETIGGLNYIAVCSVTDESGHEVYNSQSLYPNGSGIKQNGDGTCSYEYVGANYQRNVNYTATIKIHLAWNNPLLEANQKRRLEGETQGSLTFVEKDFEYPKITSADENKITWEAVEGATEYTLFLFGKDTYGYATYKEIKCGADLEFDFAAYKEETGFDISKWVPYIDSTVNPPLGQAFFYFYVRPLRPYSDGSFVKDNTYFYSAPTIDINSEKIERLMLD